MAATVRVAAAQLGPASPTKAETVDRIVALLGAAGDEGVGLVVFPELALSPYFAAEVREDLSDVVEASFPSEATQPIVAAVRAAGLTAVLPFAEMANDALYNSSAILGPDGTVLGRYRKNHIPGKVEPDPAGGFTILEKRYFIPGDLGFPLYPSPAGPLGVGICYDRRFPELYRSYALQGAGVIACCFNTPVTETWGTLEATQVAQELAVRGGAVSNAVAVVAAGKAGVEAGQQYSGGSCVIDHRGMFVAKAATVGDELVVGVLDLDAAAQARARMDLAQNLRPEIYVTEPLKEVSLSS